MLSKSTSRPIILGIDPGFGRLGIAVIEKGQKETLLYSECFETSSKTPHDERLHTIFEKVESVIKKWKPTVLAIEKLFFNKNITTGIKVAEVRGVIIALAKDHNLTVCEYNPLQVKAAVAGYGKATKEQMILMVPKLIKISRPIQHDDEYDAIAIALTCSAVEKVKRS